MVAQYYHSIPDKKETMEALARVGLEDRAGRHTERAFRRRTAAPIINIIKSFDYYPVLILADEPTEIWMRKMKKLVMNLFRELNEREGIPSLPLPIPTMSAKRQNGSLSSSMDICVKEEKKKNAKNLKKYGALQL